MITITMTLSDNEKNELIMAMLNHLRVMENVYSTDYVDRWCKRIDELEGLK